MNITRIPPRQIAEWDAYVAEHAEGSPWHLSCWAGLIQTLFGHEPHYLMAVDDAGQTRGVLPIIEMRSRLFGHFLCSVPYFNYGGVLADDRDTRAALIDKACRLTRERGAEHLELRHQTPFGEDLAQKTHKLSMWLELPESSEALWKGFKSKLRSQIRRPGKEGATARVGGPELLDDFYDVFSRNMRDLGTPVYPKDFFRHVMGTPPEAVLVVVYLEQQPVAAGMLVGFGDRIEIPWASSLREYNRQSVNMLLYWQALQYACEQGYRIFDFGRSSRDESTHRFKKQWGAEEVPLTWEYWLPEGHALPELNKDNPKYALAIRAWQHLPLAVANRIGPPLVRNLP